jgi:hypothetical protein
MKTIFTLFLSVLASISLMAADVRPKSNLVIRTAERGDLRVVIDGRRFESNDQSIRIRGIDAGNHRVRIYRERNNGRNGLFGNRFDLVFDRQIRVRPQTNILISIDRFGRASVQEGRRNNWNQRDNRDRRDKDDWEDDRTWDRNRDFDYDGTRNPRDYEYDDNYGYSNRAMSDMEFNRVLQSMQREWLETNKQKSASHVISSNYLATSQVKQILQLFSFENIKLDLAKQAYSKTVDQRNYESVMDVFSFSSSREELRRFIRSGR